MRSSRDLTTIFSVTSELLSYPSQALLCDFDAILEQIDRIRKKTLKVPLTYFCTWASGQTLEQLQLNYVDTFDFSKKRSLHLTYFTYGDTRNRGSALARLAEIYRENGLNLSASELPDFLPVLLEFAAITQSGFKILQEFRSELEMLEVELRKASSPYSEVISVVGNALGPISKQGLANLAMIKTNETPTELVGLEPLDRIHTQKLRIR